MIIGCQDLASARSKREIGERKHVGKATLLSGKNKVLVGFLTHIFTSLKNTSIRFIFKSLLLSQSCDKGSRCVVLECPLQGVDGTTVELRSRLWNSTFIEVTLCASFASFPPFFGGERVQFLCIILQKVCVLLQDYAALLHLDIVVRASLVLHSQAKNIILRTPDTDVSKTPHKIK